MRFPITIHQMNRKPQKTSAQLRVLWGFCGSFSCEFCWGTPVRTLIEKSIIIHNCSWPTKLNGFYRTTLDSVWTKLLFHNIFAQNETLTSWGGSMSVWVCACEWDGEEGDFSINILIHPLYAILYNTIIFIQSSKNTHKYTHNFLVIHFYYKISPSRNLIFKCCWLCVC